MTLEEVTYGDDRELGRIADLLAKSHKILLVTGAGISTSCGIPDFRSKDGLYSLIPQSDPTPTPLPTPPPSQSLPSTPTRKRKFKDADEASLPSLSQASNCSTKRRHVTSTPTKLKGKDLFDARVWNDPNATSTFYSFIASLRTKIQEEVAEASQTHKLIRTLRDGGRLMRCYTQNIDGLERREGLVTDLARGHGNKRRFMKKVYKAPRPASISTGDEMDGGCEVVPLHGDLDQLRCNICHATRKWTDEDTNLYLGGTAPSCLTCLAKSSERQNRGKRGVSVGLMRPNIVLYNEGHPFEHLLAPLSPFDISQNPEVLIIMGTSLSVHGLQKLVREFAKAVHARKSCGRVIFVNRTKPAGIWNEFIDDWISMDCDEWVLDLKSRREDLWLRQGELAMPVTKSSKVAATAQKNISRASKCSRGTKLTEGSGGPLGRDVGAQIEVMVSMTLPKQHKPKHKRGQGSTTPEPNQESEIRALPTPPASRRKSKSSKLMDRTSRSQLRSNTPWREDDFDSPTKRRRIDIYKEEDSPPYERIKDVKSPIKREALTALPPSANNINLKHLSVSKGSVLSEMDRMRQGG